VKNIEAYQFKPRAVESQPFDIISSDVLDENGFHQLLDFITLELEAGRIDVDNFVFQLFDSVDTFSNFCDELAGYDECYRITDRWHQALMYLTGALDEEGFITCEEIAGALKIASVDQLSAVL
jgi:hypothetical protein